MDDARLSTEVLLAHASGCRRIDLYARFDRQLPSDQLDRFRALVKRAAAHEPVAYLVGEKEFFSLKFTVTREVLIPRAETEELVECVVDLCAAAGWTQPRILDVGTGTGCIAIAILVQLREATAVASDFSQAALDVAKGNAARNGVLDRLAVVQGDRLALPPDVIPEGGFDVLVCNPPYIPVEQVESLDSAVRDFEPHAALTDGGDGLSFYRAIAHGAAAILSDRGAIVLEVGDGRSADVLGIMSAGGMFKHGQTRKDRVVGKERVLVFHRC